MGQKQKTGKKEDTETERPRVPGGAHKAAWANVNTKQVSRDVFNIAVASAMLLTVWGS